MTIFSLLFLRAVLGFAQEQPIAPSENPEATTPPAASSDIQWLWGEVVSADFQKNELLIKYVDYDTDTERNVTITVSDKTTYENVKSLLEVKPQDMVSIDYTIDSQGRNIARNVSVEKPEPGEAQAENSSAAEMKQPQTAPQ
jgi:hypothetical protein